MTVESVRQRCVCRELTVSSFVVVEYLRQMDCSAPHDCSQAGGDTPTSQLLQLQVPHASLHTRKYRHHGTHTSGQCDTQPRFSDAYAVCAGVALTMSFPLHALICLSNIGPYVTNHASLISAVRLLTNR